jgi:hypothetical protein
MFSGAWQTPVPPFYLIRLTNGFFAAGGVALFAAKEAKFPRK